MKMQPKQSGFMTAVVLVLLTVGVIGLITFRMINARKTVTSTTQQPASTKSNEAVVIPNINSKNDLKDAINSADKLPISTELSPEQFDEAVKNLL